MNVGLVAHDGKKNLMQNLCIAYQGILKKHKLYATSTTGQMIEDVANLKIHKLLSGHFGGISVTSIIFHVLRIFQLRKY